MKEQQDDCVRRDAFLQGLEFSPAYGGAILVLLVLPPDTARTDSLRVYSGWSPLTPLRLLERLCRLGILYDYFIFSRLGTEEQGEKWVELLAVPFIGDAECVPGSWACAGKVAESRIPSALYSILGAEEGTECEEEW